MDSTALASIVIGLGATIAAMVFPSRYPNAPKWLISGMWWGGIVMILGGFGYLIYGFGMIKSVPKFEPLHLISIGLLIAAAGVVWQYYQGYEAWRLTLAPTAKISSPLRPQLSFEDQQFRAALRSFAISNLNDVKKNAARVFSDLQSIDRTKNEGQPEQKARDHFIHFATSAANDFHYSNIKELAKPAVEDIDADQLQNLIYEFFQDYQLFQKHIASLNGVLKVNLLATEPMQRWLEADGQCRIELGKLKAWPQANRLKEIPESIFASSEDRIWSKAP